MKIKHSIFALTFALPLFAFANTSHASNKYTAYSDSQLTSLNSLVPLITEEFSNDKKYQSCLLLDPEKQTFLVAKSKQLLVDKDENGNEIGGTYDLTLYLIDGLKQKILKQKLVADNISSDALHFDGIELDTTPFSTLPNKNVVGLLQKFSHSGGISHGNDDLYLLKIDGTTITPIGAITTNEYVGMNWDDICRDKGYHQSNVKRTLILSNQITNGLQDIVVKTTKTNEQTTDIGCNETKNVWRKQQVIKFDDKQYRFKPDGLEPDGM